MQQGWVGSKGELFLPKEIRDTLKLNACSKVIYKIESGRLIVESVSRLEGILLEEPEIEISLEEFKKQRKELSTKAET